jgi:DNA helicase-2/ATP-dependent DNA helicase PcrA
MPLSSLNKEQYLAASASYGKNLIIASAGTGKTSTIVARIAHLLNDGVKPQELLLLTFTNKAAAEMIERLSQYFDSSITKKIESGTFHAISYRLLKRSGIDIVLKQPKDLKLLLRSLHEKRNFSYIDAPTSPYSASHLYDLYSLYQNRAIGVGFGDWMCENYPEHEAYGDIYEHLFMEYYDLKKRFGYVDFNDLLINFREHILKNPQNFKEVLVDEYQDTNRLQGSLIDAFACNSLFCVGDYDQSIYGFNGADISIIGSFSDKYPDSNIYTLTKNYRSSKEILSLANRVISKNERLYPKELEVTKVGDFPAPKLMVYDELFIQYEEIAKKIESSSSKKEDIAVIFRNNSSADGIEANLRELGISCKRKGGTSFFETREIKAMLDMFTIMINPRDMMSFIHIFEYARGVGGVFAKDIFDALYKVGDGDILQGLLHPKDKKNPYKKSVVNHQMGLFDDIFEEQNVSKYKKYGYSDRFLKNPILKHSKMNKDLIAYLNDFYTFIRDNRDLKSPRFIVKNIAKSELFARISENLATKRATQKDGSIHEGIKEDALKKIKVKADLLEHLSKNYKDKYRFINALTLGGNEMSDGEGVNLLSIHASKGLEFREVYIVDLMDGRFPNRKLMSKNGNEDGINEERRLFYVAVTRAKEILNLSYANYDKIKKIEYIPSPFLEEAGMVKSKVEILSSNL